MGTMGSRLLCLWPGVSHTLVVWVFLRCEKEERHISSFFMVCAEMCLSVGVKKKSGIEELAGW